jgi:hypothetical protein
MILVYAVISDRGSSFCASPASLIRRLSLVHVMNEELRRLLPL